MSKNVIFMFRFEIIAIIKKQKTYFFGREDSFILVIRQWPKKHADAAEPLGGLGLTPRVLIPQYLQ